MLSNKKLIDLDQLIKKKLQLSINQKNYDLALRLIELSAHLQYNYCFNESWYDKELEGSLKQIADLHLATQTISPQKDVIMFYDYFGYDNRGLTQQYLRALKKLNKKIILVFENEGRYYKNEAILSEIKDYAHKEIYYLNGETRIDKAENLFNIILSVKPESILMHLIPWDTIAYLAFYKIKGITRYQINLTDQAFWLGVDITDINIGFRSYGLNLSEQFRNIPKQKNKLLPYYPILSSSSFQGFDFETKDKKIIFAGSTLYKVLGNKLEFFETIHRLLNINKNLIFVLAGSGNADAITKFIDDNNLNNRIFLIGDRYDLFEIMKKVDYYIATFPFAGALMTQIAAEADLPIFLYVKENCQYNDIKDLFYKTDNLKNFDNLDNLIENFTQEYKQGGKRISYKDSMITEAEFAENLDRIFNNENPMEFLEKRENVENSVVTYNALTLESENLYNPSYQKTIDNYLSHWEKFKIFPEYRNDYYKKLLKEDKLKFAKTLYYQITGKI
ncbi:hypothetical protein C1637_03890 [Chryseobacterium lactis]|uniref:Glycosyltransferase n=1 Tax=Chryseobacterium lactis TaxID=1241981 RepID=A0A3G6RY28_CHRLC|nr:hypothetical protein [Chryseobacterium lactis]AZA81728.1 hypothetical protein EG342_07285 [Chryseobacterium lactis]AZB06726.1 hypothetical protein EG341_23405 [Chryseobacterium lactis]PNW15577.1 hypothetical protein C1637_03890 [Chryseobacterium lactis]